jgi:hypothetical protein
VGAARITRAKKKIAAARIPYAVPAAAALPSHLDAVLTVIHLLDATGHTAHSGASLVRDELTARAGAGGVRLRAGPARCLVCTAPDQFGSFPDAGPGRGRSGRQLLRPSALLRPLLRPVTANVSTSTTTLLSPWSTCVVAIAAQVTAASLPPCSFPSNVASTTWSRP